jgi:hypothetical protein
MRKNKPSVNDVERPSHDEIETLCATIQSEWTDQQKHDRRCSHGGDASAWAVPQFLVHHRESVTCGKGITIVYRRID